MDKIQCGVLSVASKAGHDAIGGRRLPRRLFVLPDAPVRFQLFDVALKYYFLDDYVI